MEKQFKKNFEWNDMEEPRKPLKSTQRRSFYIFSFLIKFLLSNLFKIISM
jgi:hypothetical protein